MKMCIVDCIGNLGGGTRFSIQMINSFIKLHPETEYHLYSFGDALLNYEKLIKENNLPVKIFPIKINENEASKNTRTLFRILKIGYHLLPLRWKDLIFFKNKLSGFLMGVYYLCDVSTCNFEDYDIIWFPWIHRHIIPSKSQRKIFGSFHDTIILEFPEYYITSSMKIQDMENTRRLFQSSCNIVISSNETRRSIHRIFNNYFKREIFLIPLAGNHTINKEVPKIPIEWSWFKRKYIFYPANTSNHKNHEVLIRGIGRSGMDYPLVLTGEGTKLEGYKGREKVLKDVATNSGLKLGDTIIGLGYVPNTLYSTILENAWAVIMPSLAEGGGSFPVWEALLSGVPVICSDIPVIREQLTRIRGEVIFFNAKDPADLAKKIVYLNENYQSIKERTMENIPNVIQRTWDDVASDYWNLFEKTLQNNR